MIVTGGAAAVGGNWKTVVAAALGESLSIVIDKAFADMSQTRAAQLFDSAEFVNQVVMESKLPTTLRSGHYLFQTNPNWFASGSFIPRPDGRGILSQD
ncbi:MAG: hypothetical protein WBP22_02565 [Candidatus Saccharimonas sp.]